MDPPTTTTTTPPSTMHMVSRQSQAAEQARRHTRDDSSGTNRGPPPVPATDPSAVIPAEAAAVADVYTWWTGQGKAPWMVGSGVEAIQVLDHHGRRRRSKSKTQRGSSKSGSNKGVLPSGLRRTTTGNALFRLDSDLSLSISAVSDCIPFCGKTVEIRSQCSQPFEPSKAFRVVVLFWAPPKIVAAQKSLHISGSSERAMVAMLEKQLGDLPFPTVLTVAYLLPRWENTTSRVFRAQAPTGNAPRAKSKFMASPPSVLAYAVWQLGLRLCMLKPHVVLSTSNDLARLLDCTGGMDVTCLCSPEGKKAVAELPLPPREPLDPDAAIPVTPELLVSPEQLRGLRLKTPIHRIVLNLKKPSAAPVALWHPKGKDECYHLRCPHPYLLTRKPRDEQDAANQISDRAWFHRTMSRLAAIGRQCVDTTAASVRQRVVMRLGKRPHTEIKSEPPSRERPAKRRRKQSKDVVEDIDDSDTDDDTDAKARTASSQKKRSMEHRQCYLVTEPAPSCTQE